MLKKYKYTVQWCIFLILLAAGGYVVIKGTLGKSIIKNSFINLGMCKEGNMYEQQKFTDINSSEKYVEYRDNEEYNSYDIGDDKGNNDIENNDIENNKDKDDNNINENSESKKDDDIKEDNTDAIDDETMKNQAEIPYGEGAEQSIFEPSCIYVQVPVASGPTYTAKELSNSSFTINKFFTVPSSTKLLPEDVNIDDVMGLDMTIKGSRQKPQILIYHTHSHEMYKDSEKDDLTTGVIGVGNYLTDILANQFGYNVIHCTDSFDVDALGNPDRTDAYKRARVALEKILKENPTIEVILDIHRDGVDDSIHFVKDINGKKTAKIMFFNGLCRDSKGRDIEYGVTTYRKENLAMSLQLKLLAEEYYPGFTRKNYVNAYHYNMNLKEKSMLIEVGAQTNTLEEAKNAMEPLGYLLNELLQ